MRRMQHLLIPFFIIMVFVFNQNIVRADTGPKPTLDIIVENLSDHNYYLDLLGKSGEYGYFEATDGNKEYDSLHNQPIYKYDVDGWKAISMRTWLLSGKLIGETSEIDKNGKVLSMKHSFGYVGVPKVFKIIIQKSNGTLQVSDIITNNNFNTVVYYDMKQNKVLHVSGNIFQKGVDFNSKFFQEYLLRIVITLIVEMLIAIPFFYRTLWRFAIIAIVNFATQTLLTIGMIFDYSILHTMPFNTGYFVVLLIGEILVLLTEYLLYLKFFGKDLKWKIAVYTVIANLISCITGFLII
ncbi:MAG: hypothetical protein N3B21_02320 [Clostridia bacterium]|nr:hypothetical protein [Clostridia bacterium]